MSNYSCIHRLYLPSKSCIRRTLVVWTKTAGSVLNYCCITTVCVSIITASSPVCVCMYLLPALHCLPSSAAAKTGWLIFPASNVFLRHRPLTPLTISKPWIPPSSVFPYTHLSHLNIHFHCMQKKNAWAQCLGSLNERHEECCIRWSAFA